MASLLRVTILLALASPAVAADVLEITSDTTLDPSKTYGPTVIKASGITLDGRGATILGPGREGEPKSFRGEGISARGVDRVTIRNVKVRGFETALHVSNAKGWTVESCDVSGNFHDPEFGWGEQGRRGGILLERVSGSTVRKNRANKVWDALALVDSDGNTIEQNDFSHTSNTGLKLWHSSANAVSKNDFSYGLRIKPGEVHARDSTGVLIESGSDRNTFRDNDVTHGGDGIFIRSLNNWVSVGNVFERNDCSYANNNGFEAWSPFNIYRNNKANHCSYGFWLGASDHTVLIDNEANENGLPGGFHNSPHLPKGGHAGIVFMFGSSSHTLARGNVCKGNNGAGIALIGDPPKFKAYHWVIEDNVLEGNRWGLYARHSDWIDLAGNTFRGNREADFSRDETVTHVREHDGAGEEPARWSVAPRFPRVATAGREVAFSAGLAGDGGGKIPEGMRFAWDFGEGPRDGGAEMRHTFAEPGPHRVGVTVTLDGRSAPIGGVVYVVDDSPEIDPGAAAWSGSGRDCQVAFQDDRDALAGDRAVKARIAPYGGGRVALTCTPAGGVDLEGKASLVFWLKTRDENLEGWQGPNPVVTLAGEGGSVTLTPKLDRLAQPPMSEGRWGWTRFEVPLKGGEGWDAKGPAPKRAATITLGLDSWGSDPLTVWIDGVSVK